MKIVLIGAGEVGFHVAKALIEDGHDITAVDINPEKCRRISENLDAISVEGNGASPKILHKADVENADYVLTLTRIDEVNLIAAQQAHVLGAKHNIARLRNQQYSHRNSIIKPEKFGVDLVIHPEQEACIEISRLVRHPYATQVMDFEDGRLQMLGFQLGNGCSQIIGKSVKEICEHTEDYKFGIITVLRNTETIVPWADFVFEDGDIVYFILRTENVPHLKAMLGKATEYSKRIMIVGGSKIGRSLAYNLQDEMNIRLVEKSREKAEHIANIFDNIMVINADGTDIEFLQSENIQDIDSFIAVSADEQTNILSGMLAHHFGVMQSIIHVNTTEFLPIIQELGIGPIISKNMSTVNTVLRKIRSDISDTSVFTFEEIDVDVLELQPELGSRVTMVELSELSFPKESIVGVINHHGHLNIARGSSRLTAEDTALVFAKKNAFNAVRKLFRA